MKACANIWRGKASIREAGALAADGGQPVTSEAERIILDVSSIARWIGPAVGILRIEQALARYASVCRPDIVLSIYDKPSASFLEVKPIWAKHIVSWQGAVGRRRGRLRHLLPSPYSAVGVLERWRSQCTSAAIAQVIEGVQETILLLRRRRRRGVVPFRLAIGGPLKLGPRDVIISTGPDWTHKDATAIGALKQQFLFRYVVMCHDIIPLILPQYFSTDDVAAFLRYWTDMFALADKILVNSRRVACDIMSYCDRMGIQLGEMRLVPVGCDVIRAPAQATLPDGLETSRFILYVSTIEPRKGHSLLIRVWRRLLAEGVPQQHRFKLVFVGRPGWQVDAVLRQIDDGAAFAGTVMHFVGIGDNELASFYRAAAFCVYPSFYEGLGLPIIEAFSYGKAVIASNGGALPEAVDDLSPSLDPSDEDAWFELLRQWIEDPRARMQYEAKILTNFSRPTWERAASQILEIIRG
jgi:glycosyltransferase involved in cell wall biosynthesis